MRIPVLSLALACGALLGSAHAQTTLIFDSFARSGDLDKSKPETSDSGSPYAVYQAAAPASGGTAGTAVADGLQAVFTPGTTKQVVFFLPFTGAGFHINKVYTLTAQIKASTIANGPLTFFGFGAPGAAVNGDNRGGPVILTYPTGGVQALDYDTKASTYGAYDGQPKDGSAGFQSQKIVITTGPNMDKIDFYNNNTLIGTQSVHASTMENVTGIFFRSQSDHDGASQIQNLTLTVDDAPAPSSPSP